VHCWSRFQEGERKKKTYIHKYIIIYRPILLLLLLSSSLVRLACFLEHAEAWRCSKDHWRYQTIDSVTNPYVDSLAIRDRPRKHKMALNARVKTRVTKHGQRCTCAAWYRVIHSTSRLININCRSGV